MARRPVRLTPFTRFLLIMIIVAPLAYMGAAYYNGEDGWEKLQQLVGMAPDEESSKKEEDTAQLPEREPSKVAESPIEEISNLKRLVGEQETKIRELSQENQSLRKRIEELEKAMVQEVQ